jgi:hypothetical protein
MTPKLARDSEWAASPRRASRRLPGEESRTIGESEGLVETEDGEVGLRTYRAVRGLGEPGLRSVFDQQEAVLVAPSAPPTRGLGKTKVVNEVQCARPLRAQRFEILEARFQSAVDVVEARIDTRLNECFDLRAVVVGRNEHLAS